MFFHLGYIFLMHKNNKVKTMAYFTSNYFFDIGITSNLRNYCFKP